VPKKIRELKRMLKKAGFLSRPGKGSHTHWWHARRPKPFTVSGKDGSDAKPYQEREVEQAIREAEEGQ
jgi:predicted RNA binding protein YcfA (HicA-like mRNA interferase family)